MMEEALNEFYKGVAHCSDCSMELKSFCPDHGAEWEQWAKHYHQFTVEVDSS